MPCTLDYENPINQIRLLVGDISDIGILNDDQYRFFLKLHNDSVKKASIQAAQTILFYFSSLVTERVGVLEIESHQAAQNYYKALSNYVNNPNFSSAINTAGVYCGGISRQDIENNYANPDNLVPSTTRSSLSESDSYPSYYQESNPFNRSQSPRNDPYSV